MRLMITLLNVNVMNCWTKWENVRIWFETQRPYFNILIGFTNLFKFPIWLTAHI